MEDVLKDSRFVHIASDPRFKRAPRSERIVKIDERFQSMFKDKRFQLKYTVDKRGRPVNQSATENFKKYYDLASDEESCSSGSADAESDKPVAVKTIVTGASKWKVIDSGQTFLADGEANKICTRENKAVSDTDSIGPKSNKFGLKNACKKYGKTKKLVKKRASTTIASSEQSSVLKGEGSSDEEFTKNIKVKAMLNQFATQGNLQRIQDEAGEEEEEEEKSMKANIKMEVKDRLRDMKVDYARGVGTLLSDSSSDEESTAEEDNELDGVEHGWGELDRDAERTDETTCRLAVCNMNWDRIKAADLMVLCASFLPPGGILESVTIYPSEFGAERMKEEEQSGPPELLEKPKSSIENAGVAEATDDMGEGLRYHMERLRQYQLNRLKYYYAVLVCDSVETANKIYTECDGLEYESSATRLDLRFVPESVIFDQDAREVCTSVPERYEPHLFTTTALQQGRVELTWDETDPRRVELAARVGASGATFGDVNEADLRAYLASSSSDEQQQSDEDNLSDEGEVGIRHSDGGGDAERIARYRSLLAEIEDNEEKKKQKGVEMEITWGVGLKEKTDQLMKEKLKGPRTPFEELVERKKERSKEKRQKKLQNKGKADNDVEDKEGNLFSDDDVPSDIDLNDPYFKEEMLKKPKEEKKSTGKEVLSESVEFKQKEAELELLLMGEGVGDESKSHFSIKSIQEQEANVGKKGNRKKWCKQLKKNKIAAKGSGEAMQDTFHVDVADERFSALYSSHHFNIDPADPHFRQTKATQALILEKQARRTESQGEPEKKVQRLDASQPKMDAALSMLVKSVKRKTSGGRN